MTLWWIGDVVLLVVVVPIVVYLLNGVLTEARGIVPSVRRIGASSQTTIAFLPPSSIEDPISRSPESRAMLRPVLVLPVNIM